MKSPNYSLLLLAVENIVLIKLFRVMCSSVSMNMSRKTNKQTDLLFHLENEHLSTSIHADLNHSRHVGEQVERPWGGNEHV